MALNLIAKIKFYQIFVRNRHVNELMNEFLFVTGLFRNLGRFNANFGGIRSKKYWFHSLWIQNKLKIKILKSFPTDFESERPIQGLIQSEISLKLL